MVRQKTRHRSGKNHNNNNKPKKLKKIKINLPKIKLKTPRPKKLRRPARPQQPHKKHRKRPGHRQQPPPRDSREVQKSEKKPTSGPPPPPPPPSSPSSSTPPTPSPRPTEYHLSEPKPTKLFKFELSEAKPTVYPLIANTPVSHGTSPTSSATTEFSEISEVPSPNLGGSPAFYFRDISDGNSDLSSEINGEIFPEELTNSINEFSEVAGSDGKLKSLETVKIFKRNFIFRI